MSLIPYEYKKNNKIGHRSLVIGHRSVALQQLTAVKGHLLTTDKRQTTLFTVVSNGRSKGVLLPIK
ncbi:MAG TPA: hypothetical protein DCZ55_28755 [Cyanobacteria bacterium UBA11371]|nr:hypothetical protein [Cyanobacteria bacterium UBA11371]HBE31958.1 hypothetical protein [Cyanobacteria bacterium UBA11368]